MPDNVKQALAAALRRLLRPLIRIMLREGLTYPQFAVIARSAFIECARRDFGASPTASSPESVSILTGVPESEIEISGGPAGSIAATEERNNFARVLHGWHNDRDYVGPYGFPIDLPFLGSAPSFTALVARHTPGIPPEVILKELRRISAVREVGDNVWQPQFREYIDPNLSPENIRRMGSLTESLLSTLENNTRRDRDKTDLFERTMIIDEPLSDAQLLAFQSYLKNVGGQFLQRVDAYAAIDLREEVPMRSNEIGSLRAGLQCFLFIESGDHEAD